MEQAHEVLEEGDRLSAESSRPGELPAQYLIACEHKRESEWKPGKSVIFPRAMLPTMKFPEGTARIRITR